MNRPPFQFFSLDDVVRNHDAKVTAIAAGDLKAATRLAEASGDFSLCIALGQGQITREDFNEKRDARLRDRAERLEREGHEPRTIAGKIASTSVFGLTARRIRSILK